MESRSMTSRGAVVLSRRFNKNIKTRAYFTLYILLNHGILWGLQRINLWNINIL